MDRDMSVFKPMLATKVDFAILGFPKLGSAKLDGIRCLAMGGRGMSRSMKLIPNRFVQAWFATHAAILDGMDGELIVGSPTALDVMRVTSSAVMSEDGEPDFTYYVFDRHDVALPYLQRVASLEALSNRGLLPQRVRLLEQEMLDSLDQLTAFEQRMVDIGYEGAILRDPMSPYKQGRSTAREGYLLKLKRWEDAEAIILGFEEEMHNGNEAMVSEIGRTKRSSHQANKTGKGRVGAYIVQGLTAFPDKVFNVGGSDAKTKADDWTNRDALLGKVLKYKYFVVGIKDLPRHPIYLGLRDEIDLDHPPIDTGQLL
jgi:DNA ligase-1